ncbi:hypothetical protein GCM10010129_43210 [Streptomyces fumigatiscleroticus]|nr:hypothetical protein GCM10010129_43210 [Streptomyces fumigatiscleroticus]
MRPYAGWQQLRSAADWVRPSRQMAGTPYWYVHTGQWRYGTHPADALDPQVTAMAHALLALAPPISSAAPGAAPPPTTGRGR